MKFYIGLIILFLLNSYIAFAGVVDSQTTQVDTPGCFYDIDHKYVWTNFTASTNYYMNQTELYLQKSGSPTGDMQLLLYEQNATNGLPKMGSGPLSRSNTYQKADAGAGLAWFAFIFNTPPQLIKDNKYVLVLNSSSYANPNYILWGRNNAVIGYATGSGANQTNYTVGDVGAQFNFKTYSYPASTTQFNIIDKSSGLAIEGATITIYRNISNSWVVDTSKSSDISGAIEFEYIQNENYKFWIDANGYEDLFFYLTPILFDSYTIRLDKVPSSNLSQDYDKLAVYFEPTTFKVGYNNFSLWVSAPYSNLNLFGYNISFPGGSRYNSSTAGAGGYLYSKNWEITNANSFDRVKVIFYYQTNITNKTFTSYYPIIFTTGNYTIMANADNTYGMGLFERFLLATFVIIFAVGIATLIGQPVGGFVLGLLILGYFGYIGLLPLWGVLITITIGLLMVGLVATNG